MVFGMQRQIWVGACIGNCFTMRISHAGNVTYGLTAAADAQRADAHGLLPIGVLWREAKATLEGDAGDLQHPIFDRW